MTIKSPILGQLYRRAIVPACVALGLDSQAARNLLLGTAAQESGGLVLEQTGGGPALSPWQIEPATMMDILDRLIATDDYRTSMSRLNGLAVRSLSPTAQLPVNLLYAAAVCRLKYWFVPAALPAAGDIAGLGAYWKDHYNTPAGAGTAAEFIANFERLIGAAPVAGEGFV